MEYCNNLKEFLKLEKHVIEKNIDYHKWCNGIEDKEEAVYDFITKYAWIMREVFCNSNCKHSGSCELKKEKYDLPS